MPNSMDGSEDLFFECEVASSELAAPDDQHDGDGATKEHCHMYASLAKRPCCGQCLTRFPRTCAVMIGVVIPLISLTFVSLGWGAILADWEGIEEIRINDDTMESRYVAGLQLEAMENLTMVLPRLCYSIFVEEKNNSNQTNEQSSSLQSRVLEHLGEFLQIDNTYQSPSDTLLIPDAHEQFVQNNQALFDSESPTNTTEFFEFMVDCGLQAGSVTRELLENSTIDIVGMKEDLSFNWIRCYDGSNKTTVASLGRQAIKFDFRGGQLRPEQRSNEAQAKLYSELWELDRERLFHEYYNSLIEANRTTEAQARVFAANDAARDATGSGACVLNAPAAAWFWFTIQTTVGYGNQAPSTSGGRALVFTVGFISMLAFAGLLGTAGYILAFLVDDYMERSGVRFIAKPWVACILWGTAYYLWMMAIAAYTIKWKRDRLNIELDSGDAYWFAYISTTTVGLGDIFLEPEGMNGPDVLVFSALFLLGFTLLAAFLSKFSELVVSFFGKGRTTFVDTLLAQRVEWRRTFANRRIDSPRSPADDPKEEAHEK